MKKIRLISMICVLALFLSACGSPTNKQENEEESGGSENSKTKLTWWTFQRHDMDFMKGLIDEFNETNEYGIEVEYNIQTENYDTNLELAFQSKQAPDIIMLKGASIMPYVKKKMITPITDYITDDIRDRYANTIPINDVNTSEGEIYSLPRTGVPFRYIYNQELFDKAGIKELPTTLDEMVEYAKKITEVGKKDGEYGVALNLKSPSSALWRSVDEIAKRSGVYPYDYKTGQYDFSGMKPIILAYRQMVEDGSMFPGAEGLDIDPLRTQFAAGKIGMYVSGAWEVGVYGQQFPTDIDWRAAPIPTIDGTVKGKTNLSAAGIHSAITSQCENPDLAWKVLEFIQQDKHLIEYQEKGYGYIIVPSAAEVAEASDEKGSEYFQIGENDGIWPITPISKGVVIEGKTYYDEFAAVIIGEKDIDTVIEDLNKRYNEAVERAIEDEKIEPYIIEDFDPLKL